jgi:hypothetical protein
MSVEIDLLHVGCSTRDSCSFWGMLYMAAIPYPLILHLIIYIHVFLVVILFGCISLYEGDNMVSSKTIFVVFTSKVT